MAVQSFNIRKQDRCRTRLRECIYTREKWVSNKLEFFLPPINKIIKEKGDKLLYRDQISPCWVGT